jgi:SAM-dependent methyltransferase
LARQDANQIHYPEAGSSALAKVEADHFWFTERRAAVLWLLREFSVAKRQQEPICGLDLGCGSGFTSVWLSELGYPTLGVDAHRGFAEYQASGRGFGFLQGDILSLEPKAEFDFLLLLDTLEHIENDRDFLNHAAKALKPGGIVIATVPAFIWLWSAADDRAGHFRRYVRSDLSRFEDLPGSKLKIQFASYFYLSTLPLFLLHRSLGRIRHKSIQDDVAPLSSTILNSALKWLLKAEFALARRFTLPVGSSLFVVLQKKAD